MIRGRCRLAALEANPEEAGGGDPPMSLFLIGEHHGKKILHAVKAPACRVGRDPASDLVLPSQTVSRHHATIEVEGTTTRVRDLGSRNGTRVNGKAAALEPLPIRAGDRVEFGSIALRATDREPIDTPLFADDAELSRSLVLAREDTGSADMRIAPEPKTWRLLIEAGGIPVHAASLEETFDRILELVDRAIPATRLLLLLKDEHGVPAQRAARTRHRVGRQPGAHVGHRGQPSARGGQQPAAAQLQVTAAVDVVAIRIGTRRAGRAGVKFITVGDQRQLVARMRLPGEGDQAHGRTACRGAGIRRTSGIFMLLLLGRSTGRRRRVHSMA